MFQRIVFSSSFHFSKTWKKPYNPYNCNRDSNQNGKPSIKSNWKVSVQWKSQWRINKWKHLTLNKSHVDLNRITRSHLLPSSIILLTSFYAETAVFFIILEIEAGRNRNLIVSKSSSHYSSLFLMIQAIARMSWIRLKTAITKL